MNRQARPSVEGQAKWRPAPVDRRCRPGERVTFDIHGPSVTCEEWLAVLAAAPNGKGGTDAPVDEAAAALRRVAVGSCTRSAGTSRVRVTFGPAGRVVSARLDRGPLVGTEPGRCLERLYGRIVVRPYRGGPFTLAAEPRR